MARPQSHKRRCANTRLPVGLTDSFRERISGLRASVKADYLKTEIFSKFVSDETDPADVRRTRAINKWLATEANNEATNDRLILTPEDYNILPRVRYVTFVDWCRELIASLIGETVPVDALIGSFSGGASTSRKRAASHPASKYLGQADVTESCLSWFELIENELPGWLAEGGIIRKNVVPGNVLFTVPKKTDIDRVACKEPDLNMFIQKGIGTHFRESLLRTGINLNDQSINRSLARQGSITGELATLDLSSASDSVSDGLVSLLLPECWYSVLDAVRCRVTIIDGDEHRNHMFSSMGNGFTFELESLLFYVLARATCFFTGTRGIVSVYGDDIICPSSVSDLLIHVLSYFGFETNVKKSFSEGPFRESCGGHFSDGFDITPFYVKHKIHTLVDLIDVANKLRQWGTIPQLGIIDPEVEDIWLWLKSYVPKHLWGGGDTSFKFQLVSNDVPKLRLQEETRAVSNGHGGYFHWLNTTWRRDRITDGVETSRRSKTESTYRLRPIRLDAVPRLPALFLHEVRADAEILG